MSKWKDREVGALWKNKTDDGRERLYLKMTIDGQDYVFHGFENEYKQEDKHPDFRLYKDEKDTTTQKKKTKKEPKKTEPAPKDVKEEAEINL